MAKFSKKVMGKEVGDAKVYAEPHTMNGKPVKDERANMSKLSTLNPSVGAMVKESEIGVKTTGIKMRGTGAATKGVMSRGPMA
jgi:hypothetical protein